MQRNQNKTVPRKIGDVGEEAVCAFLVKNGYEILDRNFTIRGGEIDIIAKKNDIIAFVEVKSRKKDPLTSGEEAVTKSKQAHIIKTAERYLESLSEPCSCRFDVAVVELDGGRAVKLKYYVSAFDASK